MEHIVTITIPVSNPAKMEAEAHHRYNTHVMIENKLRLTPSEQRQYHEMVAQWDIIDGDPHYN